MLEIRLINGNDEPVKNGMQVPLQEAVRVRVCVSMFEKAIITHTQKCRLNSMCLMSLYKISLRQINTSDRM